MSEQYFDDSMALSGKAFSRIQRHPCDGEWYFEGEVGTVFGFVTVMSQADLSRFDFIYKGRLYMRTLKRGLTKRGLATLANRFAKEIVGA